MDCSDSSRLLQIVRATGSSFDGARSNYTTEAGAMKDITNSIKRFLVAEDGPTAVEYAVMLAMIITVCLVAIQAVGTNTNNKFNLVKNALT